MKHTGYTPGPWRIEEAPSVSYIRQAIRGCEVSGGMPFERSDPSDAGICEIPLAHYSGPVPVSELPAFTEMEIDECLSTLEEEV